MLARLLDNCDASKSGPHEALLDITRGTIVSRSSWKSKTPGAFKVPLDVEMPAYKIAGATSADNALELYGVNENGVYFLCARLKRFFIAITRFVNDKGDADLGPGALNQHGNARWEQL